MKLGICLLLLAVTVVTAQRGRRYRSGYACRKYCGYGYSPVCSTDSQTYDNECMLRCDWAYRACGGKCPCYRPRPRPEPPVFYEPAPVYYTDPAPSDCTCGPDKDYVCTVDGETFDNECEAKCDGKVVACDGPCPCS